MRRSQSRRKSSPVTVGFSRIRIPDKKFSSRTKAREWIMSGIFGCDGAERDHYVSLLIQLDAGLTLLDYDSI